ncbi:DUF998 domain-containing protein [Streptomyces sp. INA 01156]
MTHTLSATRHPASVTSAARPAARRALTGGAVAGPLFLALGVAQGLARDGFDFTRNAISQLALGEAGWIQTVNFLLTGVLLIMGATGLRRALRGGTGGTWGPVLVGCSVPRSGPPRSSRPTRGRFPRRCARHGHAERHGAAHMVAGMVGYLALCAAFVVLARPLAARGHHGWARASRLVPVAVLAGFTASAAFVPAFTAGRASACCGWPR